MSSILDKIPEAGRVAVIRLRSMGDSVLTTPAIHLLKRARPDLQIGVVVERRFAALFEGNPDVSDVLSPGIRNLRRFGPELCVNLHGGPVSTRLTALSGAKHRAGFGHFANQWAYNVRIPRAQEILGVDRKVHTAEHLASAMFFLGVPEEEIPGARLFVNEAAVSEKTRRRNRPYAVIHPGASHSEKAWPGPFFLNIAQHLKRHHQIEPVFVSGPGEDLSPFQMWPALANAPLNDLKALVRDADLFVGNDSGPAHVAAAFGTPVVVLFGPSDPVVWAPWRTASETLVANGPMHEIAEAEVRQALDRLRVQAA